MELREVAWGEKEYKQTIDLRDRVLRKPIGMCIFDDNLSIEKHDCHFGVFEGEKLLGTCLFRKMDDASVIQMKQVAVEPELQGKHVGKFMMDEVKKVMKEKGYATINVHARHTAFGYYQKMGFEEIGDTFLEVGILHHNMNLVL